MRRVSQSLTVFVVIVLVFGITQIAWAGATGQTNAWPDPPARMAPQDGETTSARPTFEIQPVQNGDWYEIQIDDADNFSSPLLDRVIDTAYTPVNELSPGTYYWRVRARNVSGQWGVWSSAWRFTVSGGVTTPGEGNMIGLGQSVTGTLSPANPSHIWRFDAQVGEVITVRMADTDGVLDSYLELYAPDGALLVGDDDSGGGQDAAIANYHLPVAGRYTLVTSGYNNSTGSYVLSLSSSTASGRTIQYGQQVSGTLTAGMPEQEWQFTGTAGDVVTIAMEAASNTLDPWLELRTEQGGSLAADDDGGVGQNARIDRYELSTSGVFVIVAKGWNQTVGAYTLTLSGQPGVPTSGTTLEYGEQVTGVIGTSGAYDRWEFLGRAGDVVTISMNGTDGQLDSMVELYDPAGSRLVYNDDGGKGKNALVLDYKLPRDGRYLIVARGYDTSTGGYELQLQGGSGEMVHVPAGWFTMGRDDGMDREAPTHRVYLDAFYIDRYEVTNAEYKECVDAGACPAPDPSLPGSNTRRSYYPNPDYANYPVIMVSWGDADAYCRWANKRLPTEAEWEKAAGWDPNTEAMYDYPWGNSAPTPDLLNYGESGFADTTEVGSYPEGRSPTGAYDMAGNVWEWVNDWYSSDYYARSPERNPTGPASGTDKIYRGGSWRESNPAMVRVTFRGHTEPENFWVALGFRCAKSAP